MNEAANDLVIYGSPVSPFARKAMALCIEKGVEFDFETVNIMPMPDWFKDISPMRRIPVLRDRSISAEGEAGTIADSSAMCGYIERKHPEPALYGTTAYGHGRALMIEEYADTVLAPAGGGGIFRPIFFSLLQGKEPDIEKARDTWANEMPSVLAYLNTLLEGREFFVDDTLSIADIAVVTSLMQVELVAQMPLDDYPALAKHNDHMKARPSIAEPFAKADRFIRKVLPDHVQLT
ncbi:glutathione S-transferase family protein [Erythrobacter sp. SCSIO 43205]|uniref:glutathione S-transferase family protein n=1 Tax=Erythrobacter sp. SCSIO 43205 TaxID=2779361 RepID=UPI001CA80182|nr:glutathione S-transferase family protein [Erythrobacter sp. SCSIO 43205]UAB78708.1 glutathione S-transferase family protein [Erythrobacter sp. SCSIO 43205]